MKPLKGFKPDKKIKYIFTDIDDTLTDHGQLGPEAYDALWRLHKKGIGVIPVTGRPAGWCEMIARQWPVQGVVGENGGLYFRYENSKMKRYFAVDESLREKNRKKLDEIIAPEILKAIPGCAIASDQFSRLMDLAIDFSEDVKPLPKEQVKKIVGIFEKHRAHAKISSIHVNGWFGDYDKLSTSLLFMKKEFGLSAEQVKAQCAFSGDSPNDEPMFDFFPHSFGVANVQNFKEEMKHLPQYVASQNGGRGFAEIAKALL